MVLLGITLLVNSALPQLYGPTKLVQLVLVCGLCWHWRKLVPELTWKFHWSVVPVSIVLCALWVMMRNGVNDLFGPDEAMTLPVWADRTTVSVVFFWSAAVGHLLTMVIAVPMIEEVFNRSVTLRCLHRPIQAFLGVMQIVLDFPVIGEWLMNTKMGDRLSNMPAVFGPEFERNALGQLSLFGVTVSTAIFMAAHPVRDWPGALVCGVVWCLMLAWTKHKGLGPVIWSHAITNALLWGYVMRTQDWQFM